MAQQKQLSWTDLRVGIFVLAGLIVAAVAIFYVTGGKLLGAKYRLVTYVAEVNGVSSGRQSLSTASRWAMFNRSRSRRIRRTSPTA